jgi:hypothetical protein
LVEVYLKIRSNLNLIEDGSIRTNMERLIEEVKERPMGLNYHRKWEGISFIVQVNGVN